jgi:hypothetical protein
MAEKTVNPIPQDPKNEGSPLGETSSLVKSGKANSVNLTEKAKSALPSKPTVSNVAKEAATTVVGETQAGQAALQAAATAQKVAKAAKATQAVGSSALGAGKAGIALLANPVSWIVIGVVALVTALIIGGLALYQVVGQNENIEGCVGKGATVGQITMNGNNADLVSARNVIGTWLMTENFQFLGDKPMTKEQAAAILGNMQQESGLTPSRTQSNWISPTASNAEVRAAGESTGGAAIGLIQWDSGRKKALLDYADSVGKVWSDVTAQLGYLKIELESPSEAGRLLTAGFNASGANVAILTEAFEIAFERAGIPAMENRITYATEAYTTLQPGGTSGGSCLTGNFDGSSAVALAISIAYPTTAESRVGPTDSFGVQQAPEAYKAAKKAAEEKSTNDTFGGAVELYASCDRFVATVVKNTMDVNIPWGSTTEQYAYFMNHPELWQRYTSKSQAKPGDVWITVSNGHVILYIGNVNGEDSIAHASYLERVGGIGSSGYLNEGMVDTSGRQYAGFHFLGSGAEAAAALPTKTL